MVTLGNIINVEHTYLLIKTDILFRTTSDKIREGPAATASTLQAVSVQEFIFYG